MRFSSLLPALTILSSVFFSTVDARSPGNTRTRTIKPAVRRTRDTTLNSGLHELEKRALVTGCATVRADVRVPITLTPVTLVLDALSGVLEPVLGTPQTFNPRLGAGVDQTLCLCLQGGALTTSSAATLRESLSTAGNANIDVEGISANVVNSVIQTAVVGLLGTDPAYAPSCGYQAGAIPNSCSSCSATCADGVTDCAGTAQCPAGQVNCRGVCARTCVSGIPGFRRRQLRGINADLLCPKSYSACAIAGRGSEKYECLDTSRNIETCGGCEFPLDGGKTGIDCTLLSHIADVSCIQGRCVVETCMRGYVNVGGECVLP